MKINRRITVTLCIMAAITLLCFSASAKSDNDIYYGREALAEMDNSTALLYAYDSIVAGIENSLDEIDVYNEKDNISTKEIEIVFDAYRRDRGDHFWMGNRYTMSGTDDTVMYITPQYIISGDELKNAKIEFDNAVDHILDMLTDSMTEFEKELYIHDLLANKIVYEDTANAHNAYGALVEGKAVCEGYAEAFQYLLQRAGIRSFLALGYSENPSTKSYEAHCWNIVRIDGKYYHTDLTWNDQDKYIYHAYFNITTTAILVDHAITEPAYAMPICDSEEAMYFNVKGGKVTEHSVQQIAQLLSENNFEVGVYVTGSVDMFKEWLKNSMASIGAFSGADHIYGYSYSTLGREVYITIHTCLHEDLYFYEAVPPTCTVSGSTQHYLCECGALFSDPQAKNRIYSQDIYIAALNHDYSEKIIDEAHFRANGTCQSKVTYFYDCSRCDSISPTTFFSGDDYGEHEYDTSSWSYSSDGGHGYSCTVEGCDTHTWLEPHLPGPEATPDSPQICLECEYEIAPKLPKFETMIVGIPSDGPYLEIPFVPGSNKETKPVTIGVCRGNLNSLALVLPVLLLSGIVAFKKKDE